MYGCVTCDTFNLENTNTNMMVLILQTYQQKSVL